MKPGQYVRCPIVFEENDVRFPRNFVLGQIVSINRLAETVTIKLYDPYGTKEFYQHIFNANEYPMRSVAHCAAFKDSEVFTPEGPGKIVVRQGYSTPSLQTGEDEYFNYYIQLSSGETRLYAENKLKIAYNACDYSPMQQMQSYEFQNPSWYAQRNLVSQNMHLVDNAVYGFRTISGCRTFLMEHQIATVVRAFETRPIRYMLADEVGLGKTVEACSIVKILASENKNLRVLYIVPGALAMQWQNELKYKFDLTSSLDTKEISSAHHFILPMENILQTSMVFTQKWDVLVVDETHRLLNAERHYRLVSSLSKCTANVLLLSATPIQERKEEYLRLLRLLLPSQYEKMTLDAFSSLLKKQKRIRRTVNTLLREIKKYDEYQEDIYESLKSLTTELDDKYLRKLLSKYNSSAEDHGESIVTLAISFICENYQIQRKVIRNRRTGQNITFGPRSVSAIPYVPATDMDSYGEENVYNVLLQYLEDHNDGRKDYITGTVQPLLMAMFSSPWALLAAIKKANIDDPYLCEKVELWQAQGEDEIAKTAYLLDEHPEMMRSRLMHVLDWIEQEIDFNASSGKIVIFTNFIETLRIFERMLIIRKYKPVCFCRNMTRDALEQSVYEFQNNPACKIILCDETGGEGRNFQNADWLIHLDLPWTANAIEQRIGRLDRLGRDTGHMEIHSIVPYAVGTIEEQLFEIWNKGLNIFKHSISGLEIMTGDLNSIISDALCEDISGGLRNAVDDIIEIMLDASDAVEDEQQYDSGATIYRPMSKAIEHLLALYQDGEGNPFRTSMMQWATQAGLIPAKDSTELLTQFNEKDFSLRAAQQAILIPPNWEQYQHTSAFRYYHAILGTFDRATAIKREDLLFFAPGDSVFDAIVGNAVQNGRGRCTAVAGAADFNFTGFAFTYNVEPDKSYLLDAGVPLPLVYQFSMYLPLNQFRIFVPLNQQSERVPEAKLCDFLSKGYILRKAVHLGKRSCPNGESRLERFIDANPPEEWKDLVVNAEYHARLLARKQCKEESDIETARREIQRLVNGREAEYTYLQKDMREISQMREQYQAIYNTLRNPAILLDSACFIKVVSENNGVS